MRKTKAKYLSDDADVFRQVKCLYIRGNIISRKFASCSINVKLVVVKTYCSCLYTSRLWGACLSRTMHRLKVAYNDSLRMVLGIPRYCSASEMFAYTNVPSCQCVIRLNILYCIDSTFALQSCVYTQASLVPLPHRAPP